MMNVKLVIARMENVSTVITIHNAMMVLLIQQTHVSTGTTHANMNTNGHTVYQMMNVMIIINAQPIHAMDPSVHMIGYPVAVVDHTIAFLRHVSPNVFPRHA
jgi:hypothetical protein